MTNIKVTNMKEVQQGNLLEPYPKPVDFPNQPAGSVSSSSSTQGIFPLFHMHLRGRK